MQLLNSESESKKLKIGKEEIDLSVIRSKEIKKFEKAIRDFTTRNITKKTKEMRYEFAKDIKRIPILENEYMDLAVRVSNLERMLGKKQR